MDKFNFSLTSESNTLELNDKSDSCFDSDLPRSSNIGEDDGASKSLTVPNIFNAKKPQSKSKMIQIYRLIKENKPSQGIILFNCPFCNYTGSEKSGLTQHISRTHIDVNFSSSSQLKNFKCVKCQTDFEAFASLHKHMETNHETDSFGAFQIFVEGHIIVRKDIKICFLCSTLIASLEQLYKHPDVCPFAHTTGTHLNSSIVYATGNHYKALFIYQKSEIKVTRKIVELLQPHLPKSTPEEIMVKRAVAKKSTGPRPQIQEAVISAQIGNIRRAVARKSTGPYLMSSPPSTAVDRLI